MTSRAGLVLLARAQVARQLIRHGLVDPHLALSYVVWPSEAIRRAERGVPTGTLIGRAYSKHRNT